MAKTLKGKKKVYVHGYKKKSTICSQKLLWTL